MKNLFSNSAKEVLQVAKQWMYSLKVLTIGLFIPFCFLFGIGYKTNTENVKSEVITSNKATPIDHTIVDLGKISPNQNS